MEITAEFLRRVTESARDSAQSAADDRETRDDAIYEADQQGWSTNKIHRASGLSLGHTQRIIIKETARRQARVSVQ